jgi:SdrD B-like protein
MRVPVLVLALLAMPIAAGVAQGRGKQQRVRSASLESDCKQEHSDALSRAVADGHAPYGLDKKCQDPVPPPPPPPPPPVPVPPPPPPPPPSDEPPLGIHLANGLVYEDVDGNGSQDPFAGEMGLAGWTVQLIWNSRVIQETLTAGDGSYSFSNLGSATYSVCVVQQSNYNRTEPAAGNSCGGAGYDFFVRADPFQTWYGPFSFGEMANP